MNRKDDGDLIFEAYLHTQSEGLKEAWGIAGDIPSDQGPRSGLNHSKPGADPEHLQKVIDWFSSEKGQTNWPGFVDRQFESMAEGNGADPTDESGVGEVRNMYYPKWKNEDFQTVINAINSM